MNKTKRIALFYGGKMTKHLKLIKAAANKEKVALDLISYNQVFFDTETLKVRLRGQKKAVDAIGDIGDYKVLFFRTTGKHWEEVDLILSEVNESQVVIDPLVKWGKPSYACKAWQMLQLQKAGIRVPKTIYGSLWYLYEVMSNHQQGFFVGPHALRMIAGQKKSLASILNFPVILKGSGGDRGTRVFKSETLDDLEKLVRGLRKTETEEGKRYMVQEYIENKGDYRILVLGEKVLGVMKRTSQSVGEFRNNFSVGGKVEISDLPEAIKVVAVKAAKVCGLSIAGVDIIYKSKEEYYVLEVNKGPQFWGFMEATKIDVPREIVNYLISL